MRYKPLGRPLGTGSDAQIKIVFKTLFHFASYPLIEMSRHWKLIKTPIEDEILFDEKLIYI